jgi:hypothetical protein
MLELGSRGAAAEIDARLDQIVKSHRGNVLLIGGPPCQAYSLVGRARNKGTEGYEASKDNRHFLYKEYIRILKKLMPAAFVMENVKGLLLSSVDGGRIFDQVLDDLSAVGDGAYRLIPLMPRSGQLHVPGLEGRAYVGEQPPQSAMPSKVISHVRIDDADWAATNDIALNPGLVAIIGARGSGKTALADVIAAGCDAIAPAAWRADENVSPSFLARARKLIGDATTTLTWGGGADVTRALDGSDANGHMSFPRARYLSQQFVEELCSAKGVSDGLVDEIERVIFESHSQDDREWAMDFAELREQQTSRFKQAREREADAIADISERVATEFEKERLVVTLTTQVGQKKKLVEGYTADRAKLVVKGTEAQVTRHTQLSDAAQKLRNKIQSYGNQRRTFVALQDEVRSMRATGAPEMLRQAQARHPNSGMDTKQWDNFLLVYKGDVDKSLGAYIAWADGEVAKLNGVPPPPGDSNVALIANNADLASLPLAPIVAEMTRLEALFSADKLVRDQYTALTNRIT